MTFSQGKTYTYLMYSVSDAETMTPLVVATRDVKQAAKQAPSSATALYFFDITMSSNDPIADTRNKTNGSKTYWIDAETLDADGVRKVLSEGSRRENLLYSLEITGTGSLILYTRTGRFMSYNPDRHQVVSTD